MFDNNDEILLFHWTPPHKQSSVSCERVMSENEFLYIIFKNNHIITQINRKWFFHKQNEMSLEFILAFFARLLVFSSYSSKQDGRRVWDSDDGSSLEVSKWWNSRIQPQTSQKGNERYFFQMFYSFVSCLLSSDFSSINNKFNTHFV